MKILKVTKIENNNCNGLEVEFEIKGEEKIECFDDYDYWMKEENGEKRFITRLKENAIRSPSKEQKQIKTEQKKYQNMVIK